MFKYSGSVIPPGVLADSVLYGHSDACSNGTDQSFGCGNRRVRRCFCVHGKKINLIVIPGKVANPFVHRHHYSGTVVNNSSLHFGVFLDGRLHGVMSYGPSLNKSKIMPLVAGTGWNEYLELNRMAFDNVLPRNSESRAIALSMIDIVTAVIGSGILSCRKSRSLPCMGAFSDFSVQCMPGFSH